MLVKFGENGDLYVLVVLDVLGYLDIWYFIVDLLL